MWLDYSIELVLAVEKVSVETFDVWQHQSFSHPGWSSWRCGSRAAAYYTGRTWTSALLRLPSAAASQTPADTHNTGHRGLSLNLPSPAQSSPASHTSSQGHLPNSRRSTLFPEKPTNSSNLRVRVGSMEIICTKPKNTGVEEWEDEPDTITYCTNLDHALSYTE